MDPKTKKDLHHDDSETKREVNFNTKNPEDEEIRSDDDQSRDGKGNMLNANHTDPDVMTGRGLEESK